MQKLIAKLPGGKKTLVAVGIIIIILGLIVFNILKNRNEAGTPVQVTHARQQKMGETVLASGKVQLMEKQEIYASSPRMVKNVPVKVGDQVKKGQIVLEMECDNEILALDQALATQAEQQAAYDKALAPSKQDVAVARSEYNSAELTYLDSKKNLERTDQLYKAGAVSLQELEKSRKQLASDEALYLKAQRDYELLKNGPQSSERHSLEAKSHSAQTAVSIAQENLKHYVVPAQFDGVVMSIDCSAGELAGSDKCLIVIGNPDNLEVEVGISEADATRIQAGQKVEIESTALPDKKFQGTVEQVAMAAVITKSGDSQQIEVPVKIGIDSKDTGLLPGFTVDMKITTVKAQKRLTLAYEAIVEQDKGSSVWKIENGKAKRVKIKTGIMGDLYAEIVQGINARDDIILNPPGSLKEGQAVRPAQGLPQAAKGGTL
jgi:HlyD family secretion protein